MLPTSAPSLRTHSTVQMLQVCQYQQAVICLEESSTHKHNMSSPNLAPFCRQSIDSLTNLQACQYQQAAFCLEALPHTLGRLLLPEPAPFKPRILCNCQQIAGVSVPAGGVLPGGGAAAHAGAAVTAPHLRGRAVHAGRPSLEGGPAVLRLRAAAQCGKEPAGAVRRRGGNGCARGRPEGPVVFRICSENLPLSFALCSPLVAS